MDLPIDEMSKKGIAPPYVPEMQKKKKRKVSFVRCNKNILTKKNFVQIGKILSSDYFSRIEKNEER